MLNDDYVTKLINLERVKFKDIDIQSDAVRIQVSSTRDVELCPNCCLLTSHIIDKVAKEYRDLNFLDKICYIEFDLRRFECRKCFKTFNESISFAEPFRRYTNRFEFEVYECCRETTATYAAAKFGICDKTAAEIYQNIAKKKQLDHPLLTQVIGIDEIALHKGHKDFVVVITDITNKKVIDVVEDRKKAALEAYMGKWSEEFKSGIKYVAIDLWGPYRSVIETILPNSKPVADRFHVMQNLNKALDNCRKEEKKESVDKEVWKNAKYIVLKNYEDLTEEQTEMLLRVLEVSPTLKTCHELKESFRKIFNDSKNKDEGRTKLYDWILNIAHSEITEYYEFVRTLLNWKENILNYFEEHISSGFVEGVNNKIKLIKRKAFGFNNFENFRIKIIDCFS
jgi:transposase